MTTQVIAEIDELIALLEAQIPANPNSSANQRLQKRLERELSKYFKALEDAFPYDQVEQLYYKYVKEQLGSETRDILDPLLATFDDSLTFSLNGHLAETYISGQAEMITWGKTKAGIPIAYEGPPISQAINWAEKHGAELVTQMDAETKRRLAQVVSDGIKNKRGVPGLARDIRKDFANMSRYRSQLIAKSETRQALFAASHDNMVAMEIDGKEWVLGAGGETGNCEDCQANAAMGIIPVEQEFPIPEGDIHPGCLLPNTLVNPLGMELATRAYYSGRVIELHTASGNRLTITPNHPILTPIGFIMAQFLNEGDYVISCLDRDGMIFSMNPDYQQMPSRIKDIWDSLILTSGMALRSMKVAPVDFHGDAGNFEGDVDIVYPYGFLEGYIINTFFPEHISQHEFAFRDTKPFNFSRFGFLFPLCDRAFTSSRSLVGIGSKSFSFSKRESFHSELDSLAIGTDVNSPFNQVAFDNTPVYSQLSRQFQDRVSASITPDNIIEVREYYFSGHVYNLQSLEQLYIANNIVVKNCTCAIAPARLSR